MIEGLTIFFRCYAHALDLNTLQKEDFVKQPTIEISKW